MLRGGRRGWVEDSPTMKGSGGGGLMELTCCFLEHVCAFWPGPTRLHKHSSRHRVGETGWRTTEAWRFSCCETQTDGKSKRWRTLTETRIQTNIYWLPDGSKDLVWPKTSLSSRLNVFYMFCSFLSQQTNKENKNRQKVNTFKALLQLVTLLFVSLIFIPFVFRSTFFLRVRRLSSDKQRQSPSYSSPPKKVHRRFLFVFPSLQTYLMSSLVIF